MSRSKILVLRTALEKFKFSHHMRRLQGVMGVEERSRFMDKVHQHVENVYAIYDDELALDRTRNPNESEKTEFKEIFFDPVNALIEEWDRMKESVRNATYNQPLNYEEKVQVVAALNFGEFLFYFTSSSIRVLDASSGYSGHFYNCPNGHTFVITEVSDAQR